MFLNKTTFRVTTSVSLFLVMTIAVTAFISTLYRRERLGLGQSHFDAGLRLEKKGDLESAVEEYRKALIYSPDKTDYRLSFVEALVSAGRLDEAESHIDQLLQEDPTNGALNLLRGRIAARRNLMSKAIDYYSRAVYEYWPPSRLNERRQARFELIGLLDRAGKREQAIGELMTMYANAPSDQELRARIGFDLLNRSATSEGTQVFRDLITAAPRSARAHKGLGQALLTTGDFSGARHEFERALRLDPKDKGSADAVALTNSIVDLDPQMPSLPFAERYRRSQNLLRRVLRDLAPCDAPTSEGDKQEATLLLASKSNRDPDVALQMQTAAEQLWRKRDVICGPIAVNDRVVSTVMDRLSDEGAHLQ